MTAEDDRELEAALKASLEESHAQRFKSEFYYNVQVDQTTTSPTQLQQASNSQSPAAPSLPAPEPEPGPADAPPRYNIDDCIRDFSTRQAVGLPRIHDVDGDTYIFIDPPSKQPEQSDQSYEEYRLRYSKPFLMKREKLSNASGVFKERLGSPDYCFHTLRRRRLKGKLPENVKYVLDLTPPTEGEEAVFLTASLCCSQGIRYWYQSSDVWNVSRRLVGGKEEYAPEGWAYHLTNDSSPVEYSPIRHRSAIELVLAAIQGQDITFDSAIKLWTTAIVAQYFGVTYDSCPYLTDSMTTWLRAEPNNLFLEVNTEASLRISAGFQNQDLARDTFAILVGEEALDSLYRNRNLTANKQMSTFGRRKDDLPEELLERVEYASKAFIERAIQDFEHLIDDRMEWLDNLPTVHRLATFTQPNLQHSIWSFRRILKKYFRHKFFNVLCSNVNVPGKPSIRQGRGEVLVPRNNEISTYQGLLPTERILTRTFWIRLRDDGNFTRNLSPQEREKHWDDVEGEGMTTDPLAQMFLATDHSDIQASELRAVVDKAQEVLDSMRPIDTQTKEIIPQLLQYEFVVTANDARPVATTTGQLSAMTLAQNTERENPLLLTSSDSSPEVSEDITRSQNTEENREVYLPKTPVSDTISTGIPVRLKQCELEDLSDAKKDPLNPYSIDPPGYQSEDELARMSQEEREAKDLIWSSEDWDGQKRLPHVVNPSTNQIYTEHADLSTSPPVIHQSGRPFFNVGEFFREVDMYLTKVARDKLSPSDQDIRQDPYKPTVINTLTSLHETEWKFLPLWAGGLDDGTGAVYNEDVMETMPDAGFSTAGPSIHTGDSTYSSSDFDMLSDAGTGSTFNTSTAVADGHTDQLHRHLIYSPSATSGEDSFVDLGEEAEEEAARKQVAAYERAEAEAEVARQKRRERERQEDTQLDEVFFDYDEDMEDDMDSDSNVTETGDDFIEVGHDSNGKAKDP